MYKYHLSHEKEEVSHKDLWDGFKEGTTAHGIPHVSNAAGKWFLDVISI